jgi:hypothetical protein
MILVNLARHSRVAAAHLAAAARGDVIMQELFDTWLESVRFACEVQGVISMRLARLAEGGPLAEAEAQQMIAEKLDALADAEVAILKALSDGEGLMTAAERGYAPVARRVHANNCRLSRAIATA